MTVIILALLQGIAGRSNVQLAEGEQALVCLWQIEYCILYAYGFI